MAVTLHGDLMESVQKRVEEERKLASEPVQIHLQHTVEKTAVILDRALQAKNATLKSALVSVFSNLVLQLLLSLRALSIQPKIPSLKRGQTLMKFSGIIPKYSEIVDFPKFELFKRKFRKVLMERKFPVGNFRNPRLLKNQNMIFHRTESALNYISDNRRSKRKFQISNISKLCILAESRFIDKIKHLVECMVHLTSSSSLYQTLYHSLRITAITIAS